MGWVSVDSGIRSDYLDIHFHGVLDEAGSRPVDDHRYIRLFDDHRYSRLVDDHHYNRRVDGRRYGMAVVGDDYAGRDDNLVLVNEK